MGERKVLNKYLPPDFDPEQLARGVKAINRRERNKRKENNNQIKVRMMLPMSIQCNTCSTYLYKGTKFNSRKEDADESYLGIRVVRLYFRCPQCAAELAIKTDPKNSDYVVELGASRNYEPWKEAAKTKEMTEEMRKQDEEGDAMRQLENKAQDGKIESDIMNALDEMVSLNARKEAILRGGDRNGNGTGNGNGMNGTGEMDNVIDAALRSIGSIEGRHHDESGGNNAIGRVRESALMDEHLIDEENDDEVRRAFMKRRAELMRNDIGNMVRLKREREDGSESDDDEDDYDGDVYDESKKVSGDGGVAILNPSDTLLTPGNGNETSKVDKLNEKAKLPVFKIQRKAKQESPAQEALGLLGTYDSSSGSDGE